MSKFYPTVNVVVTISELIWLLGELRKCNPNELYQEIDDIIESLVERDYDF